jgi:hypothetical protein
LAPAKVQGKKKDQGDKLLTGQLTLAKQNSGGQKYALNTVKNKNELYDISA